MVDGKQLDQAIERNKEAALQELSAFCAQPSISAQGVGMREMAALVRQSLERRGFRPNR